MLSFSGEFTPRQEVKLHLSRRGTARGTWIYNETILPGTSTAEEPPLTHLVHLAMINIMVALIFFHHWDL